jgi:excisionase family DNA binding protein
MSAGPFHPVAPHTERLSEAERPVELEDASMPKVLNLAEAAMLVRCSRAHLCNVINVPHLPTVRIGRRVLFRRESLEQWLREVEATGRKRAAS